MASRCPESDRRLTWAGALCALALLLPLAWPLVTGRVFVFDDLANFHLPLRYVYANALQAGRLPLWTPAVWGGVYLHGEGQLGMCHPLHLVLYRFVPLTAAFNLELLANFVMAFAGMTWLLRRLRLSTPSSFLGATLFAFSGFALLHHHHINLVAVTVHLPWLLACIDVIVKGDRPRERAAGYAGAALVVGSAVLMGYPQGIWWNALAAVPYALFCASETRRWLRLVPCAAAAVTGLLLGAVQLVPTIEAASQSVRAAIDRPFALSYSLPPWNVVQLWSPYFFVNRAVSSPTDYLHPHELGIYSGALLALAPIWLVIRRRKLGPQRRLMAGCAVYAAIMFVLALGSYGGLAELLTYVPVLGSFRGPARYIMLVQFVLAIMAAVAFEDLTEDAERPRPTRGQILALCSPAAAGVLTTIVLNTGLLPVRDIPIASAFQAAGGVALVGAATIAFLLTARRVKWAAAALIVVTATDLGFWGIRYVYRQPPKSIDDVTAGLPRADPPGTRVWAASLLANRPLLKDYAVIPGYLGLIPATTQPVNSDFFRRLAGARLRLALDGTFTVLGDSAPRARFIEQVGDATLNAPPVVVTDEPDHVVIDVDASIPAILVLSERFDPGWRVSVDGADAAIERVNDDFLGAQTGAGRHRLEFRFAPRSFRVGLMLSALGGLLLMAVALTTARRG